VYLDVCCLKRPFDDLLASIQFIRSPAHDLENDQNPVPWRAALVRQWLNGLQLETPVARSLRERTGAFMALGLAGFDALHMAAAELAGADVFVTTDDRLLALAKKAVTTVRVTDPVSLAREIAP
jgi:predicted nucleic acid-binding protein